MTEVAQEVWVIVCSRGGYSGTLPYTQPFAIKPERYASREAAEAAMPKQDSHIISHWVARHWQYSHLPDMPR